MTQRWANTWAHIILEWDRGHEARNMRDLRVLHSGTEKHKLFIRIKHHEVIRQTEEKQILIPVTDKGLVSLDLLLPPPGVLSALSFQDLCSTLCALGSLLPP